MCITNDTHHVIRSLSLIEMQRKPISEPTDCGLPFEGGQSRVEHQLYGIDDLLCVRANGEEGLYCKTLE